MFAGGWRDVSYGADVSRPPIVIASNRGPLTFEATEGGQLVARRGAGGLVSGLGPVVAGSSAMWVAAAISDGDRMAASEGVVEAEGFRVRTLSIPRHEYRAAYETISNATLWFAYHGLFDLAREPVIDNHWRAAWTAYRRTNEAFSAALAEEAPEGAVVLVQDLHLSLVGAQLATSRPDLRCVHFSHTPFCSPQGLQVLPRDVRVELLSGLAAHRACGFHSRRWASAFEACCEAEIGAPPPTFVAPLAPDPSDIGRVAATDAATRAFEQISLTLGSRHFVVRVDRIEPSKNLLRGFQAFDMMLERHPDWRERVVFGAYVYPSREGLAVYRRYRHDVEALVEEINSRWAVRGWTPIVLDLDDNFPRSVAALQRADVVVVNPIRDGLNLVAMEAALVNQRDGALVLSTEAGCWDLLGDEALAGHGAFGVNPFDVGATADRLHVALTAAPEDRAVRVKALRSAVSRRTPADWLRDQLVAAGVDPG